MLARVALMLNLGIAGVYAQQKPVKMTFSGTLGGSPNNILPGTVTDEQVVAGDGTLGPFTFRELHADKASPQPSSSCSSGPYSPTVVGAGVLRFQDGSLLTVTVTEGANCIDLTAGVAGVGRLTMPLIVWWDGMVSLLRIYSPEQMKRLTEGLRAPDYAWEIGEFHVRGIAGQLPYLIGRPIP